MTRQKTAQVLAAVSAVAFFVAAGLHAADYGGVVRQAQQGIGGLAPFVATLWLAFAVALVVLGCIVTLVALGRVGEGRWVLALAGCVPLVTVFLQLGLLRFTRSTAVFAVVAVVNIAAAIAVPSKREAPSAGGA